MSYRLKSIKMANFKHISFEMYQCFEFSGKDLIVLEGSNGYGKSTIFDGIELLITGKLDHFKDKLLSRGQETFKVLANNEEKDIVIEGVFYSSDDEFSIKRSFKCSNQFNDELYILNDGNWEGIEQENLYDLLMITSNIFNIGIYISQNESLSFLQNKYNNRKQYLAGMLEEASVSEQKDNIIKIKDILTTKINNKLKKLDNARNEIKKEIDDISRKIAQFSSLENNYVYVKFFINNEFGFDKEIIDTKIPYDVMTEPIRMMYEFIKDYDSFAASLNNKKINEIINFDKRIYAAYYYRENINQIKRELSKVEMLKNVKSYLNKVLHEDFVFDRGILEFLEFPEDNINRLDDLYKKLNFNKSLLSKSQIILNEIIDKRKSLINVYNSATDNRLIQSNMCPLCGNENEDLQKLFIETEELLNVNTELSIQNVKDVENNISIIFKKEILPLIENTLSENKTILFNYEVLNDLIKININEISKIIDEVNIDFTHNIELEVNMSNFDQGYLLFLDIIKEREMPITTFIPNEKLIKYQEIFNTYYGKSKPKHSLIDLQNKLNYIANQYVNVYFEELKKYQEQFNKADNNYLKYNHKVLELMKDIDKLADKYKSAYKKYQTELANNIKLPLYIYSGKIIQNYPLGLGIEACINDSQIIFKASGKDNDIFNILSIGQLNGVALSILLAIKSVYSNKLGLDMLLVDDPLQSIDDISSFSFSDLLCEQFNNTQIIISTHEEDKANLFKYKFRQMNLDTVSFNMQELYLAK